MSFPCIHNPRATPEVYITRPLASCNGVSSRPVFWLASKMWWIVEFQGSSAILFHINL